MKSPFELKQCDGFKELQKIYDDNRYKFPWYTDIMVEIRMQVLLYGDVIDYGKIKEMMQEKLVVYP